ncbi:MAG: type II toxin-antitoxin system Phd/YefM family antitoxin [Oscillospiraceae bacterium]
MLIKSSSALRNDYDSIASLAKEQPVYITRNGEGEMVFVSQDLYERREAEITLLEKLLAAERNRLAGAPTYSLDAVAQELEEIYAEV